MAAGSLAAGFLGSVPRQASPYFCFTTCFRSLVIWSPTGNTDDSGGLDGLVAQAALGIKKTKEILEAVAVHPVKQEGAVATHVDQFFVLQHVEVMRKRGGGDFELLADRTDHHPLGLSGEEQAQDPQPRLGTRAANLSA